MNIFEDSAFKKVVKQNKAHRVGIIPVSLVDVLTRRGNLHMQRDQASTYRRKDHVRTQREGSHLQAKKKPIVLTS